jgi:ribosomal protein S27AE
LKKVTCPKCGQLLGKYFFYVTLEGNEPGSIAAEKTPPEHYPYTVRIKCWKCGNMAEDSNEDIVLAQK